MKKAISASALALASVLALPTAALAAALPTFRTDLIAPNKSVGGVMLGSSFAAAKKEWGGTKKTCPTTGGCTFSTGTGTTISFITVATAAHRKPFVGEITVSAGYTDSAGQHPDFASPLAELKTATGIGLGSTASAVKRAYPHATGSSQAGYLRIEGQGEHSTTFTLDKGRVTNISMASVHLG